MKILLPLATNERTYIQKMRAMMMFNDSMDHENTYSPPPRESYLRHAVHVCAPSFFGFHRRRRRENWKQNTFPLTPVTFPDSFFALLLGPKSGMQYQVGSQWQWWWHAAASAANGFSESAYYMPAIQEIQLSGAILDGVRFARRAAPLPCHVKHGRGLTFNK